MTRLQLTPESTHSLSKNKSNISYLFYPRQSTSLARRVDLMNSLVSCLVRRTISAQTLISHATLSRVSASLDLHLVIREMERREVQMRPDLAQSTQRHFKSDDNFGPRGWSLNRGVKSSCQRLKTVFSIVTQARSWKLLCEAGASAKRGTIADSTPSCSPNGSGESSSANCRLHCC